VLAFTAGIAITASVLFGVVPAGRTAHIEPIESLKEHGWSLVGKRLRLAGGLVIAQVALSLLLVVSGGLQIRTTRTSRRWILDSIPLEYWSST
jgi:hypothetical protein